MSKIKLNLKRGIAWFLSMTTLLSAMTTNAWAEMPYIVDATDKEEEVELVEEQEDFAVLVEGKEFNAIIRDMVGDKPEEEKANETITGIRLIDAKIEDANGWDIADDDEKDVILAYAFTEKEVKEMEEKAKEEEEAKAKAAEESSKEEEPSEKAEEPEKAAPAEESSSPESEEESKAEETREESSQTEEAPAEESSEDLLPEAGLDEEEKNYIIFIYSEKDLAYNEDASEMFKDLAVLKDIEDLSKISFQNAKKADSFFEGCKALEDVTALQAYKTDKLESAKAMFKGCEKLEKVDVLNSKDVYLREKVSEDSEETQERLVYQAWLVDEECLVDEMFDGIKAKEEDIPEWYNAAVAYQAEIAKDAEKAEEAKKEEGSEEPSKTEEPAKEEAPVEEQSSESETDKTADEQEETQSESSEGAGETASVEGSESTGEASGEEVSDEEEQEGAEATYVQAENSPYLAAEATNREITDEEAQAVIENNWEALEESLPQFPHSEGTSYYLTGNFDEGDDALKQELIDLGAIDEYGNPLTTGTDLYDTMKEVEGYEALLPTAGYEKTTYPTRVWHQRGGFVYRYANVGYGSGGSEPFTVSDNTSGFHQAMCIAPERDSPATGTYTANVNTTFYYIDNNRCPLLVKALYYSYLNGRGDVTDYAYQTITQRRPSYYWNFTSEYVLMHHALAYIYHTKINPKYSWAYGTNQTLQNDVYAFISKLNSLPNAPDDWYAVVNAPNGAWVQAEIWLVPPTYNPPPPEPPEPGRIRIHKISANPELTDNDPAYPWAGFKFEVFDSDGKSKGVLTTKNNGYTQFMTLEKGTYTVKEIYAPKSSRGEEAWEIDASEHTIHMVVDGTETKLEESTDNSTYDFSDYGKTLIHYGWLMLEKETENPNRTRNCSYYSLEGAVFDVYDEEDNLVATLTTNNKGVTEKVELETGDYKIIERTPSPGFKLQTANLYATVNYDQTTSMMIYEPPYKRGSVDVYKVDSAFGNPLKDAEFSLYKHSDAAVAAGEDEWVFVKKLTNQNNGHYKSGNLFADADNPDGIFRVVETKVPADHTGAVDEVFTLDEDDREVFIQMENKPNPYRIYVNKIDEDTEEPLEGAVIEIAPYDSSVQTDNYHEWTQLEYDSEKKLYYIDVEPTKTNYGYFKLRETTAPNHYKSDWSKVINITYESPHVLTFEATNEWEHEFGRIAIDKRDENNAALEANTVFQVFMYDSATGKYITEPYDTLVYNYNTKKYESTRDLPLYDRQSEVDAHPDDTFRKLNNGKYKVVEIKSAPGYINEGWEKEFTVLRNGDYENPQQFDFSLTNNANSVKLVKKNAQGTAPLANAQFKFENLLTGEVRTAITDANGEINLTKLAQGTWEVTELSAPIGFAKDKSTTSFTVNEKGKIAAQGSSVWQNSYSFNRINYPGATLSITKKDSVTNSTTVPGNSFPKGAVFTIYEGDGNGGYKSIPYATAVFSQSLNRFVDAANKSKDVELAYTPENKGQFKIEETTYPEGYLHVNSPQTVSMPASGLNPPTVEVTFTNVPNKYTITKQDENGNKFTNAGFNVWYGSDESAATYYALDGNGQVVLERLKPGVWHYRELNTKTGYGIDDAVHSFVVADDGTIDGNAKSGKTIKNYPIPTFKIKKVDALTGRESDTDSGFPEGTEFYIYEWNAAKNDYEETPISHVVYKAGTPTVAEPDPSTGSRADVQSGSGEGKPFTQIVVITDEDEFPHIENVISNSGNVYQLEFDTSVEAAAALAELKMLGYQVSADKLAEVQDSRYIFSRDENNEFVTLKEDIEEPDSSESYDVAIIDTGVDPRYADKVVSVIEDDSESNWHATLVAQAIKEVNPSASILSIKAFGAEGFGSTAAVYRALQYAIKSNVKVINLSASMYAPGGDALIESIIQEAIDAGIIVVGSAGNNRVNVENMLPGKIESAIIVNACDENGVMDGMQNYGETVDASVIAESSSIAAAKTSGFLVGAGITQREANAYVKMLTLTNGNMFFVPSKTFEWRDYFGDKWNRFTVDAPTITLESVRQKGRKEANVYNYWGPWGAQTYDQGMVTFAETGYATVYKFKVTRDANTHLTSLTINTKVSRNSSSNGATQTVYAALYTSDPTPTFTGSSYGSNSKFDNHKESSSDTVLFKNSVKYVSKSVTMSSIGTLYNASFTFSGLNLTSSYVYVVFTNTASNVGTSSPAIKVTSGSATAVSDKVTLSLNRNNSSYGEVNPTSVSLTPGDTSGNIVATPYTGYHFVKWTGSATGWNYVSGYNNTSSTIKVKAGTASGSWTANFAVNTYKVKFNGNGATSGSMSDQSFTYNEAAKALTANAFSRTGYSFAGWNTTSDGSGTSYSNRQSVRNLTTTNNGTFNLYAQWTKNTYRVTVSAEAGGLASLTSGSTVKSDMVTNYIDIPYGNAYTFTAEPNEGYHFTHWQWTGDWTNGTATTNPVTYNMGTKGGTGTAHFAENTYKIVFNANAPNATGTMTDIENIKYSDQVTLPENAFERTGYNFIGWSTDPAATTPSLDDEADVTGIGGKTVDNETVTLYAVWEARRFADTVYHWATGFDPEGPNAGNEFFENGKYKLSGVPFNAYYDNVYIIGENGTAGVTTPIDAPRGFELRSTWNGNVTANNSNDAETMEFSLTYPNWKVSPSFYYDPISYPIDYDLDDDNDTNPNLKAQNTNPANYNVLNGVTFVDPTRKNYEFLGWELENPKALFEADLTVTSGNVEAGGNYVTRGMISPKSGKTFTTSQEVTVHYYSDNGAYVSSETGTAFSLPAGATQIRVEATPAVYSALTFTDLFVTGVNVGKNEAFDSYENMVQKLDTRVIGNIEVKAHWRNIAKDVTISAVDSQSGGLLSYAKYSLYDEEGTLVGTWEQNGETAKTFESLSVGTYTIKELAVDENHEPKLGDIIMVVHDRTNGEQAFQMIYNRTKDVSFVDDTTETWPQLPVTDSNQGKFKIVEIKSTPGYVMDGSVVEVDQDDVDQDGVINITFTNTPNKFTIKKVSNDGTTPLIGAEFKVWFGDEEASAVVYGPTGSAGTIELFRLKPGTWHFQEVTAPAGYRLDNSVYDFVVDENGYINGQTESAMTIKNYPNDVNQPTKIRKVSADGVPLPGIAFLVTDPNGATTTMTTDAMGYIVIENPIVGEYTYQEQINAVSQNAGILPDTTTQYHATVGADNNVTYSVNNGVITNSTNQLTLVKTNADGTQKLAGVRFEIWRADQTHQIYTTDRNGEIHLSKLATGTWYYKELTSKDGYKLDETERSFVVGLDGKITAGGTTSSSATITVTNEESEVKIRKVDENGNGLVGAQFQVFASDGKNVYDEVVTTGANGYAILKGLKNGTYTYKEVQTLPGYVLDSTARTFTITNGIPNQTEYTVSNTPNKVTLTKTDADGNPLTGVQFRLTGPAGSAYENTALVTGTGGKVEITKMPAGDYELSEILAAGPQFDINPAKINFTVETDGTISNTTASNESITVSGTKNSMAFTMKNYKWSTFDVKVNKTDANTGAKLSGAEFKLYYQDEVDNEGTLEYPWVEYPGTTVLSETATGVYELKGLKSQISPTRRFKIVETKTPAGYVGTFEQAFVVEEAYGQHYKFEANATNVQNKLVLQKLDDSGRRLKQVEFTIKIGPVTLTKNTDRFGKIQLNGLTPGMVISIQETWSDPGYLIDDTVYTFEVGNDGVIRKTNSGGTATVTYSGQNAETLNFTVVNTEYFPRKGKVVLHKTDPDSNTNLEGAVFKIYEWDKTAAAYKAEAMDVEVAYLGNGTYEAAEYLNYTVENEGKFKIVETKPPVGHQATFEQEFEINLNGAPQQTFEYTVMNDFNRIKVTKTDENGNPLSDVQFYIYSLDEGLNKRIVDKLNAAGGILKTDADGILSIDNLLPGEYWIQETVTKPGYALDTAEHKITVDEFSNIYVDDDHANKAQEYIWNVVNEPNKVILHKVNEDGDPIEGAQFKLMKQTGETVTEYIEGPDGNQYASKTEPVLTPVRTDTTNAEGIIEWSKLEDGTYFFQEVSTPSPYILDDTMYTFRVTSGVIKQMFADLGVKVFEFTGIVNRQTVEPEVGTITLEKRDGKTGATLEGATFVAHPFSVTLGDYDLDVTYQFTYDSASKTYKAANLPLDNATRGKFLVEETSAPAGYVGEYLKEVQFPADAHNIELTGDDAALNNKNGLTVYKEDSETGERLPDAVFTLTKEGETTPAFEATTNAQGVATFEGLEAGATYILREIAAPAGYDISGEETRISVMPNGLVNGSANPSVTIYDNVSKEIEVYKRVRTKDLITEMMKAADVSKDGKTVRAHETTMISGDITFIFKLEGTARDGSAVERYESVTFTMDYILANTDANGFVELGTKFEGLRSGEYTVSEMPTHRFNFEDIMRLSDSGTQNGREVLFDLVNYGGGVVTFLNKRYDWGGLTSSDAVVNVIVPKEEEDGNGTGSNSGSGSSSGNPAATNSITINLLGSPTTIQAEEGMTWREWVDSPYNTIGGRIVEDSQGAFVKIINDRLRNSMGASVMADDVISTEIEYVVMSVN